MVNILLCEDEFNILQLFKIRLTKIGYNVLTAMDGEEALNCFYKNHIDLIIMDVMLPKLDGFSVVKEIRSVDKEIPIIMVTAKGEMIDKKEGFASGADDYMVKPIIFDELVLRIEALLRRYRINADMKITIGQTVLDAYSLTVANEEKKMKIQLTKKEFGILFKLLSFPERSFTKEQLFDEFWGYDSSSDLDSVKVCISKIRSQIANFENIDIETIRGIGYRGVRCE